MARYEHLPIYKKAFDLAVYVDPMVRGFSRYHKYTHGTDLRNGTRQVLRLIIRANNTVDKAPHLLEMREVLEDFMVSLRLCKQLKVFPNFNSFVHCLNEAVGISRLHEKSDNNLVLKKALTPALSQRERVRVRGSSIR